MMGNALPSFGGLLGGYPGQVIRLPDDAAQRGFLIGQLASQQQMNRALLGAAALQNIACPVVDPALVELDELCRSLREYDAEMPAEPWWVRAWVRLLRFVLRLLPSSATA